MGGRDETGAQKKKENENKNKNEASVGGDNSAIDLSRAIPRLVTRLGTQRPNAGRANCIPQSPGRSLQQLLDARCLLVQLPAGGRKRTL